MAASVVTSSQARDTHASRHTSPVPGAQDTGVHTGLPFARTPPPSERVRLFERLHTNYTVSAAGKISHAANEAAVSRSRSNSLPPQGQMHETVVTGVSALAPARSQSLTPSVVARTHPVPHAHAEPDMSGVRPRRVNTTTTDQDTATLSHVAAEEESSSDESGESHAGQARADMSSHTHTHTHHTNHAVRHGDGQDSEEVWDSEEAHAAAATAPSGHTVLSRAHTETERSFLQQVVEHRPHSDAAHSHQSHTSRTAYKHNTDKESEGCRIMRCRGATRSLPPPPSPAPASTCVADASESEMFARPRFTTASQSQRARTVTPVPPPHPEDITHSTAAAAPPVPPRCSSPPVPNDEAAHAHLLEATSSIYSPPRREAVVLTATPPGRSSRWVNEFPLPRYSAASLTRRDGRNTVQREDVAEGGTVVTPLRQPLQQQSQSLPYLPRRSQSGLALPTPLLRTTASASFTISPQRPVARTVTATPSTAVPNVHEDEEEKTKEKAKDEDETSQISQEHAVHVHVASAIHAVNEEVSEAATWMTGTVSETPSSALDAASTADTHRRTSESSWGASAHTNPSSATAGTALTRASDSTRDSSASSSFSSAARDEVRQETEIVNVSPTRRQSNSPHCSTHTDVTPSNDCHTGEHDTHRGDVLTSLSSPGASSPPPHQTTATMQMDEATCVRADNSHSQHRDDDADRGDGGSGNAHVPGRDFSPIPTPVTCTRRHRMGLDEPTSPYDADEHEKSETELRWRKRVRHEAESNSEGHIPSPVQPDPVAFMSVTNAHEEEHSHEPPHAREHEPADDEHAEPHVEHGRYDEPPQRWRALRVAAMPTSASSPSATDAAERTASSASAARQRWATPQQQQQQQQTHAHHMMRITSPAHAHPMRDDDAHYGVVEHDEDVYRLDAAQPSLDTVEAVNEETVLAENSLLRHERAGGGAHAAVSRHDAEESEQPPVHDGWGSAPHLSSSSASASRYTRAAWRSVTHSSRSPWPTTEHMMHSLEAMSASQQQQRQRQLRLPQRARDSHSPRGDDPCLCDPSATAIQACDKRDGACDEKEEIVDEAQAEESMCSPATKSPTHIGAAGQTLSPSPSPSVHESTAVNSKVNHDVTDAASQQERVSQTRTRHDRTESSHNDKTDDTLSCHVLAEANTVMHDSLNDSTHTLTHAEDEAAHDVLHVGTVIDTRDEPTPTQPHDPPAWQQQQQHPHDDGNTHAHVDEDMTGHASSWTALSAVTTSVELATHTDPSAPPPSQSPAPTLRPTTQSEAARRHNPSSPTASHFDIPGSSSRTWADCVSAPPTPLAAVMLVSTAAATHTACVGDDKGIGKDASTESSHVVCLQESTTRHDRPSCRTEDDMPTDVCAAISMKSMQRRQDEAKECACGHATAVAATRHTQQQPAQPLDHDDSEHERVPTPHSSASCEAAVADVQTSATTATEATTSSQPPDTASQTILLPPASAGAGITGAVLLLPCPTSYESPLLQLPHIPITQARVGEPTQHERTTRLNRTAAGTSQTPPSGPVPVMMWTGQGWSLLPPPHTTSLLPNTTMTPEMWAHASHMYHMYTTTQGALLPPMPRPPLQPESLPGTHTLYDDTDDTHPVRKKRRSHSPVMVDAACSPHVPPPPSDVYEAAPVREPSPWVMLPRPVKLRARVERECERLYEQEGERRGVCAVARSHAHMRSACEEKEALGTNEEETPARTEERVGQGHVCLETESCHYSNLSHYLPHRSTVAPETPMPTSTLTHTTTHAHTVHNQNTNNNYHHDDIHYSSDMSNNHYTTNQSGHACGRNDDHAEALRLVYDQVQSAALQEGRVPPHAVADVSPVTPHARTAAMAVTDVSRSWVLATPTPVTKKRPTTTTAVATPSLVYTEGFGTEMVTEETVPAMPSTTRAVSPARVSCVGATSQLNAPFYSHSSRAAGETEVLVSSRPSGRRFTSCLARARRGGVVGYTGGGGTACEPEDRTRHGCSNVTDTMDSIETCTRTHPASLYDKESVPDARRLPRFTPSCPPRAASIRLSLSEEDNESATRSRVSADTSSPHAGAPGETHTSSHTGSASAHVSSQSGSSVRAAGDKESEEEGDDVCTRRGAGGEGVCNRRGVSVKPSPRSGLRLSLNSSTPMPRPSREFVAPYAADVEPEDAAVEEAKEENSRLAVPRRSLCVSTRLSAELRAALFQRRDPVEEANREQVGSTLDTQAETPAVQGAEESRVVSSEEDTSHVSSTRTRVSRVRGGSGGGGGAARRGTTTTTRKATTQTKAVARRSRASTTSSRTASTAESTISKEETRGATVASRAKGTKKTSRASQIKKKRGSA